MKKKISIKNIIIGTSLLTTFALLVFYDYQRVQKDFRVLKRPLIEIRLETLLENKPLVVKSKGKEMSVKDLQTDKTLDAMKFFTLDDAMYDTILEKI